jgi:molecular chaperone GrpE
MAEPEDIQQEPAAGAAASPADDIQQEPASGAAAGPADDIQQEAAAGAAAAPADQDAMPAATAAEIAEEAGSHSAPASEVDETGDGSEAGATGDASAAGGADTGEPGDSEEPADLVASDLQDLVAKARERDEYLALAQRTQADFENYRRRMTREAASAADRGVARLANELLPALDHLELALQAAESGQADPELVKGFRLVGEELARSLAKVGIEGFSPVGEVFDPTEHEAMAQAPIEGAESGTVAQVYQQGYRLNGTILRPARVVVAQ